MKELSKCINISEEEFDLTYPLKKNHLEPNAAWAGCLFDTHGAEGDYVRKQDAGTIWTLVDADGWGNILVSGLYLLNRLIYLICTVPVPPGFEICVDLP